MDFDTRELDFQAQRNPLTLDRAPVTSFGQAFSLGIQSTLATENTNSEHNYLKKAIDEQAQMLSSKDPDNAEFIKNFSLSYNDPQYNMPRKLLKNGDIFYDKAKQEYVGRTSLGKAIIENQLDAVANVAKYDALVRKHGGLTNDAIAERSKKMAYNDYVKAETRLEATKGFWNGVAEFGGNMFGAMGDPVNIALLPFGGPVELAGKTGFGAVMKTAGIAAMQEMKIAAVAEVPIQMQAYDWKNDIGINWTLRDAIVSAASSIGAAGLIRAGGSAMIDVSPAAIKALRNKADETGNTELRDMVDEYETTVNQSPMRNIDDHIDTEAYAMQKAKNGDPIEVDNVARMSNDNSDFGNHIEENVGKPTVNDMVQDSVQPDVQRLYNVDSEPANMIDEQVSQVAEAAGVDVEYNSLERYKAEEVDNWMQTLEEDVTIPVEKKVDGETIIETKSLKEIGAEIDKERDGLRQLMECVG